MKTSNEKATQPTKQFESVINSNNFTNSETLSFDSLEIEKEPPSFTQLKDIVDEDDNDIIDMDIDEKITGLIVEYVNAEKKDEVKEINTIKEVSIKASHSGFKETSINNYNIIEGVNAAQAKELSRKRQKLLGGTKQTTGRKGKPSKVYKQSKKLLEIVQYNLKVNTGNLPNNFIDELKVNIKNSFTDEEITTSIGKELKNIIGNNTASNEYHSIKANFTTSEAGEFESIKAKTHDELTNYITNIDALIVEKEKELQELKNFKICSNEVLRQKNYFGQAFQVVNKAMIDVLSERTTNIVFEF
jgi:hypothetical protein